MRAHKYGTIASEPGYASEECEMFEKEFLEGLRTEWFGMEKSPAFPGDYELREPTGHTINGHFSNKGRWYLWKIETSNYCISLKPRQERRHYYLMRDTYLGTVKYDGTWKLCNYKSRRVFDPVLRPESFDGWRGLVAEPNKDKYFDAASKHLQILNRSFIHEVSIEQLSETDREILVRYGRLLDNLMTGELPPITAAEESFVKMCAGEDKPSGRIETAWKKYRLDVMFQVAKRMRALTSQHAYEEYRARFLQLASHGHKGAIEWIKRDNQATKKALSDCNRLPSPFDSEVEQIDAPPFENLSNIDPLNISKIFPDLPRVWLTYRVDGNPGTAR